MSTVKIRAKHVQSIYATVNANVTIELDMDENQMRLALESFLRHITDATWAKWLEEFAPEYEAKAEQS